MACIRPSNIWQQEMSFFTTGRPSAVIAMNNHKIDDRLQAGQQLKFWSQNGRTPYLNDEEIPSHLARLLGHKDYTDLMRNHNDRDTELLRALVGKHGLTIYKALLIRSGRYDQLESG